MKSFVELERSLAGQPPRLGVVLSRIDVGRGREELYRDQVPELLRSLANQTRVASVSASSAIEGVTVDPDRAERIIEAGAPARFRNRNEREFTGYRDAIEAIVNAEQQESLTVPLILSVHRALYRHTDARGGHLKTDDNLIVSYEKGHREELFAPPPWQRTEWFLTELVERYNEAIADQVAHSIVLLSAFILDLLAIHPVADGNGRVARILTTRQLLAGGYGVARYVSVEQRIYETKNAYYDSLAESYATFEARIAAARGLGKLSKQERVRVWALEHAPVVFRLRDVRRALPSVSDPTIGLVLRRLRDEGLFRSTEDGPNSTWHRL